MMLNNTAFAHIPNSTLIGRHCRIFDQECALCFDSVTCSVARVFPVRESLTRETKMKIKIGKMRETCEKRGKIEGMFLSCPPRSMRLATTLLSYKYIYTAILLADYRDLCLGILRKHVYAILVVY